MAPSAPTPSASTQARRGVALGAVGVGFILAFWAAWSFLFTGPKARIKEKPEPFAAFVAGPAHGHVRVMTPDQPVVRVKEDENGKVLTASCTTCHATREPNRANKAATMDQFHQGLTFKHGDMTCLTCHNADRYDQLRLADGTGVPFDQVMTLCGQCHSGRLRDWQNGAHGGMNGAWDLTLGDRLRKSCVECHDPHHPQMPQMLPGFKPHDRFQDPSTHQREASAHE